MSFLNPTAIAIAAGLTIPPLVALYFLKLKRVIRPVPSTFLWRRAVEDLQVNSPFQRLRSSLLLLLQLLVLIGAAIALGKPMFRSVKSHEGTIVILIDQSASMNVLEADGRTRLDIAKEQASRCVENMADDARAMVIAFCDRATVISSFDTNKRALQHKIDGIEPTQSVSTLQEAMNLAEAYAQLPTIGTDDSGADRPPVPVAPAATLFLFTDGRIERTDQVSIQRFDVGKMQMTTIGERSDNVGIMTMDARRNYERPNILEVTAVLRNFDDVPVQVDAALLVDGQNVDVQSVTLTAQPVPDATAEGGRPEPGVGSTQVIAFDEIEFGGGGVVEVALRVDDALSADDRAWTIIDPPRHMQVLLVTEESPYLEHVLATLPMTLVKMTGEEYETADDGDLLEGERSKFDVVILDRHSTERLPQGNYFFWGSVPRIDGVTAGDMIDNQVIFNWDDTHPILRHVGIETLYVFEWLDLKLPPEAIALVDGETSPVISYLTRDASQFLISAFSLVREDEMGDLFKNTFWMASADFVVFVQNAVQYLASNIATTGTRSVTPGEAVMLPLPEPVSHVDVLTPEGTTDRVATVGSQSVLYGRTRQVGLYSIEQGMPGRDVFAVNLFNSVESHVAPAAELALGSQALQAQAGAVETNEPAWPNVLLAVLVLLLIEWVVYNRRVYV